MKWIIFGISYNNMIQLSNTEDNFINELIVPFELYDNIPDGHLTYDPTKRDIKLPENWEINEISAEEYSELFTEDEIDFIDIRYNLSIPNFDISISNQDFWFNDYPFESICIVTETGIIINDFTEIIKNKEIIDFFIFTLKSELKRIDSLPHFDSLMELIDLHEKINSNYNKIWCDDVFTIYDSILKNIKLKIKVLKEDTKFNLIANILFLESDITIEKHFLKIRTLIDGFSENQINEIVNSYISLINEKFNLEEKKMKLYQFQNKKYFNIVCKIKLFHFRELLYLLNKKNNLSEIIQTNFEPKNTEIVKIPFNIETFALELQNLFLITNNPLKYDETLVLTKIISNKITPFPSNHPIVNAFNQWLNNETNLFLFKTFLNYVSSPSINLIPKGSFRKFSTSISCKFQYSGLSSKNLLKLYVNSGNPSFNFTGSNQVLIALVNSKIGVKVKNIENGVVQKMFNDFKNH